MLQLPRTSVTIAFWFWVFHETEESQKEGSAKEDVWEVASYSDLVTKHGLYHVSNVSILNVGLAPGRYYHL